MKMSMDIKETIKAFIYNEILDSQENKAIQLTDDKELLNSNLLNSLGVVKLMGFIEEKFNIDVVDENIDLKDFESITAVCNLISRKMNNQNLN
jgi:methoxymalonate biosynthesis acyl carrier protein